MPENESWVYIYIIFLSISLVTFRFCLSFTFSCSRFLSLTPLNLLSLLLCILHLITLSFVLYSFSLYFNANLISPCNPALNILFIKFFRVNCSLLLSLLKFTFSYFPFRYLSHWRLVPTKHSLAFWLALVFLSFLYFFSRGGHWTVKKEWRWRKGWSLHKSLIFTKLWN